jgi:hypothetical protein
MDGSHDRERLQRQVEQATRLISSVNDQTTMQRIREFIGDLKKSLERRRARRRSRDEIRARARSLWEIAGRPSGRNDEFWFRAERELTEEEAG